MEQLDLLRRWLAGFPGWEGIQADGLGETPGCAAIYPLGLELVQRKKDLLGATVCRCRWNFRLDKLLLPGQEHAAFLMDFQKWVLRQCALGLAPGFGDVPEEERIYAQHGKLRESTADGSAVYSVTLTAEFVKRFEE